MKKLIKYVVLLLPVLIAAVIFFFSSQPADVSTEMSGLVSQTILKGMEVAGLTETMGAEEIQQWCEILSFPVRKAAHMTEFTAFYLSLLPVFHYWVPNCRRRLAVALVLTFLYACSDEFHQLYVPGRSGQFTDVMIDCMGGAVITMTAGWLKRHSLFRNIGL